MLITPRVQPDCAHIAGKGENVGFFEVPIKHLFPADEAGPRGRPVRGRVQGHDASARAALRVWEIWPGIRFKVPSALVRSLETLQFKFNSDQPWLARSCNAANRPSPQVAAARWVRKRSTLTPPPPRTPSGCGSIQSFPLPPGSVRCRAGRRGVRRHRAPGLRRISGCRRRAR